MMLGQKVQFALAGYYATYSRVHLNASFEDAEAMLEKHLSQAMGHLVNAIEKTAPLPNDLMEKVKAFKDKRNWLVHDFDQEATRYLSRGERIPEYIAAMDSVSADALELIQRLDGVGNELVQGTGTQPRVRRP